MVHALSEAWRALTPGAVLLDVRPYLPFGPLELVQDGEGRPLGRLEEVESVPSDAAADGAIAEVMRRGLFTFDGTDSFHYAGYWDSVREVEEYLQDWEDEARLPRPLAAQARTALRLAGRGAWLRLQTYIVVNRLRRSSPRASTTERAS